MIGRRHEKLGRMSNERKVEGKFLKLISNLKHKYKDKPR
jgi:hypothetical protein